MQVKRFEAADMTEALRLVKDEFGEEAVILSAKEIRLGGFFNPLKKKSVEITAAVDYMKDADIDTDCNSFSSELSKQLEADSETDRVSLSSKANAQKTKGSRQKSVTSLSTAPSSCFFKKDGAKTLPPLSDPEQKKKESSRKPVRSYVAAAKTFGPAQHSCGATHLIAPPFYRNATCRKIIALVGSCGVGKSTTIAKLAWHCHVNEKRPTALISLDRFRIGGNGLLTGVAKIMGIPLSVVHDKDQMHRAMKQFDKAQVVLIDTPGIDNIEETKIDDLGNLLDLANPDEIHMVVNATVREEITAKNIDAFSPLGVDRLLFTHVDEYFQTCWIQKALENAKIPSSFFGDGANLFDGLKEAASMWASEDATNKKSANGKTIDDLPSGGANHFSPMENTPDGEGDNFIVNRNSELFHRPDCISVTKMKTRNVTTFSSMEKAITHGFKPCQACCADFFAEKTETESFHFQRAKAL